MNGPPPFTAQFKIDDSFLKDKVSPEPGTEPGTPAETYH